MKGDEGGIFSNFPDRKPLFLLKIKVKQNPGCPNKEYNIVFYIDQLLVKYCILTGIWTTRRVGEQVWFFPNTSGRSRGSHDTRKFLQILELIIETAFPAPKLTRNCCLNMNISFS